MKSNLPTLFVLSLLIGATAHADIVKCSSTLAGEPRNEVVFIQRLAQLGQLPSNDVVLARKDASAGQDPTLGHFKTGGSLSEVGYDVDEGVRLFVSRKVEHDQDSASNIVMGRKLGAIDDLHIYWPPTANFQTAAQFYTQIRADVKKETEEYNKALATADDKPVQEGKENVEPTSYTLNCSKVDAGQFKGYKMDANGNFKDLEAMHDWALAHAN